mmetsp:Transcript_44561/g.80084  ORF Transcript_44561/g.80084 Transcript_44561/m.80084 type:complete len:333 (-) Transcript_44561:46-1044(-)
MSKYAVAEEEEASAEAEDDEAKKVKAIFGRYDVNGDGCISHDELGQVLRMLGFDIPEKDVDRIFEKMDTNHDKRIQYTEFVDWLYGFSDISDAADMRAREVSKAAGKEDDVETPSAPAATLYKPGVNAGVTRTFSDLNLEFVGEEPDLSEVLAGLQQMGAKKLREVFQGADVTKKGFLRLGDIRRLLFPDVPDSLDMNLAVVKVFAVMDKNSDGKIHCGEFVSFVMSAKSRLAGTDATASDKKQIAAAFSAADADSSGTISQEEFARMFGADSEAEQQMLKTVFASVDKNSDGSVSALELAQVYGKELVKETKGMEVSGSMDAGVEESEDED